MDAVDPLSLALWLAEHMSIYELMLLLLQFVLGRFVRAIKQLRTYGGTPR